jgi:hypothetical protein
LVRLPSRCASVRIAQADASVRSSQTVTSTFRSSLGTLSRRFFPFSPVFLALMLSFFPTTHSWYYGNQVNDPDFDLRKEGARGEVDIPRLRKGRVGGLCVVSFLSLSRSIH